MLALQRSLFGLMRQGERLYGHIKRSSHIVFSGDGEVRGQLRSVGSRGAELETVLRGRAQKSSKGELPARAWSGIISADSEQRHTLDVFAGIMVSANLFFGTLFRFVLPAFPGLGALSSRAYLAYYLAAAFFAALSLFTIVVRWHLVGWLSQQMRLVANVEGAPIGGGHQTTVVAVRRWFIWMLGLLTSPLWYVAVIFFWGVAEVLMTDVASFYSTEVRCCINFFVLVAGALRGGKALLSLFALSFTIQLLATSVLPLFFGEVISDFTKREHREEFAIVDACLTTVNVFTCAWLQHMLLERIALMDRDIVQRATLLLRDVRTPLHGLLGSVGELDDLTTGESLQRSRHAAELNDAASTIRACALAVSDMLDNISNSAPVADIAGLDPATVLRTTRDPRLLSVSSFGLRLRFLLQSTAAVRAQNSDVRWQSKTLSTSESLPNLRLRHDSGNILQIMMNLIANACKFTPRGGDITVRLSIVKPGEAGELNEYGLRHPIPVAQEHARQTKHRWFVVEVEDTGGGVPKSKRDTIFQPYVRCNDYDKDFTDGVGLGLHVARTCAARLQGYVLCLPPRSRIGARFVVVVPCIELDASTEAMRSIARRHALPQNVPLDPAQMGLVLLVDDNALNLRILRRLMLKLGFDEGRIHAVVSAEAALAAVRAGGKYSVCVCDLVLPGINGISLTRQLLAGDRKRRRKLIDPFTPPLVIVGATASATRQVVEDWLEAGAAVQMPKPFTYDGLTRVLSLVQAEQQRLIAVENSTDDIELTAIETDLDRAPNRSDSSRRYEAETRIRSSNLLRSWYQGVAILHFFAAATAGVFGLGLVALLLLHVGLAAEWIDWKFSRNQFAHSSVALISTLVAIIGTVLNGCHTRTVFVIPALLASWQGAVDWRFVCLNAIANFFVEMLRIFDDDSRFSCPKWLDGSELILDICTGASLVIIFIIQLSFVEVADRVRAHWIHTLSHDVRAPLHGIFASIREVEDTLAGKLIVAPVQAAKACSEALLAAMDTALMLAPESDRALNSVGNIIAVADLNLLVANHARLLVDPEYLDVNLLENASASVLTARSPLIFVLSKFLSFLPLLRSCNGCVHVSLRLENDAGGSWLILGVTELLGSSQYLEADRQARARALDSELWSSVHSSSLSSTLEGYLWRHLNRRNHATDYGVAIASTSSFQGASVFVRALRYILRGQLEFVEGSDGSIESTDFLWRLKLVIPVVIVQRAEVESVRDELAPRLLSFANMHLFLVDDDVVARTVFLRMVQRLGIEQVEVFSTPDDFITRFQVIRRAGGRIVSFVDLHMPGVSGPGFWKLRLGADISSSNAKVVACTADTTPGTVEECIRVGMRAVLTKPFSKADLVRTLAALENL